MGKYDDHPYWPARAVAAHLGLGSERAARTQMQRWDVPEAEPGPNGEKRWAQQDVVDAADARPGRGHRTDIQRPNAAYVAQMILDHGGDEVPREALREAWVTRYPEDREPKRRDATSSRTEGSYAHVRVKNALAQLAREGAVARTPITVTVVDRKALREIAQRVQLPHSQSSVT